VALHRARRGCQPGPVGTKDANPKIAWRAATRLRNRIVHGYWDIDVETLVATAVDDLPDMITQLESAIASLRNLKVPTRPSETASDSGWIVQRIGVARGAP
jgi:hypothetical protein